MLSASRPVGSFMKRSDFETAQVSGFTSWPKRWISASSLIAGRRRSPFFRSPTVTCSFVIISMPPEPQHGIVDGADDPLPPDAIFVARQHQIHHQVDDVARREVLAGIFVQRFVELADQLLEDRAHRRVVDLVRVQIDIFEALEHLEEKPRLVELADRIVEVEFLQHLAHVWAEPGDVVAQVGREVRRVGEELLEVIAGRVVEGEARDPAELGVEVLQVLCPEVRPCACRTFSFVCASTQSRRRRTVSGRMTSWYLPRLNVSRIRSATPQRKLTISPWFILLGPHLPGQAAERSGVNVSLVRC